MSQGRNTIAVHSRLQRRCHWNGAPLGTIRCQQLLGGFVHRFVRLACVVPASCDRLCRVCAAFVCPSFAREQNILTARLEPMAACKGSRYCRGRQTGASGKPEHCRTPVVAVRLQTVFPKEVQTPLINQCVDCRSTVLPVSRLASECCATFSARQPSCQQLLVSATCTHRRR